jgi:hypothetical protein
LGMTCPDPAARVGRRGLVLAFLGLSQVAVAVTWLSHAAATRYSLYGPPARGVHEQAADCPRLDIDEDLLDVADRAVLRCMV